MSNTTRPLNLIVLGDSVSWGQGLPSEEKFSSKVGQWLERRLHRKVNVFMFAHSGAVIGSDPTDATEAAYISDPLRAPVPGELPYSYPSITVQRQMAIAQLGAQEIQPSQVDLVLLGGGLNDVDLTTVLNPFRAESDIRQQARDVAGERMKNLVTQVTSDFPSAKVVLTNYFPIVSTESDLSEIAVLLAVIGGTLGGPGGVITLPLVTLPLRNQLAAQSAALNEEITTSWRSIESDSTHQGRVAFADVGFTAANAYGAPNSYLWRIANYGLNGITPVDPVANERCHQCRVYNHPKVYCCHASVGHPNIQGANKYASAIQQAVERWLPEWRSSVYPQCTTIGSQKTTVLNALAVVRREMNEQIRIQTEEMSPRDEIYQMTVAEIRNEYEPRLSLYESQLTALQREERSLGCHPYFPEWVPDRPQPNPRCAAIQSEVTTHQNALGAILRQMNEDIAIQTEGMSPRDPIYRLTVVEIRAMYEPEITQRRSQITALQREAQSLGCPAT